MREPPDQISDDDVLDSLRAHWPDDVDTLVHLPVGFGAHHWRASGRHADLFVTFDRFGSRHTAESIEDTYAAAAGLATELEFVVACLPSRSGTFTAPLADGAVSVTPWVEGRTGDGSFADQATAEETVRLLTRLHASPPPPGIRSWRPLVDADFADRLAERTAQPWPTGPYGERAGAALRDYAQDIARWTAAYHHRAAEADADQWVPTHGEPHTRNQLATDDGIRLVDWESLRLAPRERDLRTLHLHGYGHLADADPALLEMYDLEWRLDEISQYADWFEAPHSGSDSDQVAWGGLLAELTRE